MKGSSSDAYTITLDEDTTVYQVVERSTRIRTVGFRNPDELLRNLSDYQPVAVFIDIKAGAGKSGLEVLPTLRTAWPFCPILVITATPAEQSIGKALNSGADDFIRKPLLTDEVEARFRLRLADSAEKAARDVVAFGDVVIDSAHRTVSGPQRKRFASPIEISLLACLANAQGSIVEKEALKLKCWGQVKVTDNALHRKMHAVRQLLEDVSENVMIDTKYGVGFFLSYEHRSVDQTRPSIAS